MLNDRPRALLCGRYARRAPSGARVRLWSGVRAIPAADAAAARSELRPKTSAAPMSRKKLSARTAHSREGEPVNCRRRRDKHRSRCGVVVPARAGGRPRNRLCRSLRTRQSRNDPRVQSPKPALAARLRRPQSTPRICAETSPWRYPTAGPWNASRSPKHCRFIVRWRSQPLASG